jgi:hypothetical protein
MTTVYEMQDKTRLNVVRVDDDNLVFARYDADGVFLGYFPFRNLDIGLMVNGKLLKPVN